MGSETVQTKAAAAEPVKKAVRRRIPKWALQAEGESSGGDDQYYQRSIGRALDVLNCFDGQTALSLKEIGKRTGLPESTLFRVLLTVEKHGYLVQGRDGTYQLAPKLIFGWLSQAGDRMRERARPYIDQLAQRFNETVSLAYLFDDRVHVLDCMETFHEIRMTNKIGRVLPPHCSAMGKAITAFQERPLVDRMLEVYGLSARTSNSIVDRQKLFEEFEGVRKTGIGYDREESILGGLCIAAAVRPAAGPVVAAVSVSTPIVRMSAELEREIRAASLAAATAISLAMERSEQ